MRGIKKHKVEELRVEGRKKGEGIKVEGRRVEYKKQGANQSDLPPVGFYP